MIEVPEVWILFGSFIHQDFLLDYPDIVSGIEYIYSVLSESDKEKLFTFLQEIQTGGYDWDYKLNIWNQSGAQFTVAGKDIDILFDEIFNTIQRINNRG